MLLAKHVTMFGECTMIIVLGWKQMFHLFDLFSLLTDIDVFFHFFKYNRKNKTDNKTDHL